MANTIHEAVQREVARCVNENVILRIAPAANRIRARNLGGGYSANKVASMLLEAGIDAAVPIEIEMPEPLQSRPRRVSNG